MRKNKYSFVMAIVCILILSVGAGLGEGLAYGVTTFGLMSLGVVAIRAGFQFIKNG